MRYIALLDRDRPIENPLMVVWIDGRREEMFVPGEGWRPCNPVYRTWFVNVAITEEHARRLLHTAQPAGPLKDPQSEDLRYYAQTGYYDEWFYYAIEDDEHPFDDPVTTLIQHWTSGQEQIFTTDLVWKLEKPTGRRIRITQEDAYAFEEIQARRIFGDVEHRYFAIVNPFEPDVDDPPCIARESRGGEKEHYDGTWVRSDAIDDIRRWGRDGTLVQLTEQAAAQRIANWTPREERTRFFACLNKATPDLEQPQLVAKVIEKHGSLHTYRTSADGQWRTASMTHLLREYMCVEIEEADVDRSIESFDRNVAFERPDDVRYRYFAIVRNSARDDVMTARSLIRAWGGTHGDTYEEVYHSGVDRWRYSILLYEVQNAHVNMDDIEITEEVAQQLQQKMRQSYLDSAH
ncbi:hypothetical protein LFM09_24330 [Lentzea alba]|uniref:hypothetical protein n=1 Tax=Lentzea alba TaxID=2714351 RepID=UPI0039BF0C85